VVILDTGLAKVGRTFLVLRTRILDGPRRLGAPQIVTPSGSAQGRIIHYGCYKEYGKEIRISWINGNNSRTYSEPMQLLIAAFGRRKDF